MMRRFTTQRQPHRPWVVWLALWLTLFAALAPSLTYAMQAAANRDAADLHAVCSASFMGAGPSAASSAAPTAPVWAKSDTPPSNESPAPTSAATGGHCALCLLSIERLAAPTSSVVAFAATAETYAPPADAPPKFVKSFLELNPPPRGPPALS